MITRIIVGFRSCPLTLLALASGARFAVYEGIVGACGSEPVVPVELADGSG